MRLTSLTCGSAVALAILAGSLTPALAQATIFVRADSTATTPTGATEALAFPTISEAIAAATGGETVDVGPGTYNETFEVDKPLTLLGPNAGIDPNTGTRGAEAIVVSDQNNDTAFTTFNTSVFVTADNVVIDGFSFDGDNPTSTVDYEYAHGDFSNTEVGVWFYQVNGGALRNSILDNYMSYTTIVGNETYGITIENNLMSDSDNLACLSYNNGYVAFNNNVVNRTRVAFQTNNNHKAGSPSETIGNTFNTYRGGVFHNLTYSNAPDWIYRDNTMNGPGPTDSGYGISIVSNGGDVGVELASNNISNYYYGYQFSNNTTSRVPRIRGGEVDTVTYGAIFFSRGAAQGKISIDGVGDDYTGGPAAWDLDNIAFTGSLVAAESGNEAGCNPFSSNFFNGNVALLDIPEGGSCTSDLSIPALNAQNAGASAVIFVDRRIYSGPGGNSSDDRPPVSPFGDAEADNITIPATMISARLADIIIGEGLPRTVSVPDFYLPNSTYGNAERTLQFASTANPARSELFNVRINNALGAAYYLWDVPYLDAANTPGPATPVIGSVYGGSELNGSPVGVGVDGDDVEIELNSVRIADNEIGLLVNGGTIDLNGASISGNTVAGIQSNGGVVEVIDADFSNQDVHVSVNADPSSVTISASNFEAQGPSGQAVGVRNNVPGEGTVLALDNYWGDPAGPDDEAGAFDSAGAIITLGVDAGTPETDQLLLVDADDDNLSDAFETELGTNPNLEDTDGDDISDGVEFANGSDPLDPTDPYDSTSPTPDPAFTTDADGDGLVAAIDPDDTTKDTDGDGYTDNLEVARFTDPTSATDFPPFGDANFSGGVDQVDAVSILEVFLGLRDFTSINRSEVDINGDGRVDNVDAIILFNFFVGNIPYIPFP